MILFLLIDLREEDWGLTSRDLFNDVVVFLNAFHKASRSNRVIVISSRRVLFDSSRDDISAIYTIAEAQTSYSVNDLGYALCLQRDRSAQIVIFSLREEQRSEYLRYLKCMSAAQRLKTRISAFSLFDNKTVSQCCASTDGIYSTSESGCLRFLLSLLGTAHKTPCAFPTNCFCHDKQVLLGLVCPVCLSVFCKFIPVCKRCKSKFEFIRQ